MRFFVRFLSVLFITIMLVFSALAEDNSYTPISGQSAPARGNDIATPEASLSVLGPYEDGKYKVNFSIWFPVPAGVTFTGYAIHSDGRREYIAHNTITEETAGGGWGGNMWGTFTGGAPIPEDIVSFRLEFTGAFTTYSVNARVPKPTQIPPTLVDVYPDGTLFLRLVFCQRPAVSLRGRVHAIVDGWINPVTICTGSDIPVAVCSGYPDSWCLTQMVDIPDPPASQ